MTQFAFSTQGIDTENRFEALPPGEYTVMVTDSEIRTTQAGNGRYISLSFDVQAPDAFRGRKIWDNMNIENPSAEAVEIAQRQLAQLVKACGLEAIQDTTQLHHIPVVAIVKVDKKDATRNQIKGYKAAGGQPMQHPMQAAAPAPAPAPQPVAPAPAAQQAQSTPPWMNQ